jgi:hypothetical protein
LLRGIPPYRCRDGTAAFFEESISAHGNISDTFTVVTVVEDRGKAKKGQRNGRGTNPGKLGYTLYENPPIGNFLAQTTDN